MTQNRWPNISIAAIIPCLNEELAISRVIAEVQSRLPEAKIYIYDNASTDRTAEVARAAGAIVRSEPRRGKGNVVSRMFADVEADIYFMTDGDLTYDLEHIGDHIQILIDHQIDMLVGERKSNVVKSFRFGHRLGNRLFNFAINLLYGSQLRDIFSGYRVMSRRFVKTCPILAKGFEIETELSVHALDLQLEIPEVPVLYKERPPGSFSKLNTIRDGIAIAKTLGILFKETCPLRFFGLAAALLVLTSILLGYPLVTHFLETGLVERLPTAILCTGLVILGSISLICGLVLESVSKGRKELKRLHFLMHPAVIRPEEVS
jgi:glycosyltransferase involved in cell wall biosynthesis